MLFWIFHAAPEAGFLESLIEIRRRLEMNAADLGARRRTAEHVRMMRYWLQQHDLSAGMAEPCGLAAYEIHRLVFEASHNSLLRSATGLVEFALAAALRCRLARGEVDFAAQKSALYADLVHAVVDGVADQAVAVIAQILEVDRLAMQKAG